MADPRGPAPQAGEPESDDARGAGVLDLTPTFTLTGQLPLDVLPAEAIARVRAGGELTPEEWSTVRNAALEQSGMTGAMLRAALESGAFEPTSAPGAGAPVPPSPGRGADPVATTTRTLSWSWRPETGRPARDRRPRTYRESLRGRRDPDGDVLANARRALNLVVWAVALGFPLLLVGVAIANGEPFENVVLIGAFGLAVGLMIRRSVPQLPFLE